MTLFSSVLVALAGLATSGNNPIDSAALYKAAVEQINSVLDYHQQQSRVGIQGGTRIEFAPVFVSPQMQWAVPNTVLTGAPGGPSFPPLQMFPSYPSYPGYPSDSSKRP